MTRKLKSPPDLETALNDINEIVTQMEQGKLSLEQSLENFERGISLIRHCQKILQDAEQKVQILLDNKEGVAELQSYNDDAETS